MKSKEEKRKKRKVIKQAKVWMLAFGMELLGLLMLRMVPHVCIVISLFSKT